MNIKELMDKKLSEKLEPTYLKVEDESHFHHVPKGAQTHFKIEIVSSRFENKKLLERHRIINEILKEEITKIRACSLHTLTPSEWEKDKTKAFRSPKCLGHDKNQWE